MIGKHKDYENGFVLYNNSTDRDLQNIFNKYDEVKCVICNAKTAKCFSMPNEGAYAPLTINNKLNDACFFINKLC